MNFYSIVFDQSIDSFGGSRTSSNHDHSLKLWLKLSNSLEDSFTDSVSVGGYRRSVFVSLVQNWGSLADKRGNHLQETEPSITFNDSCLVRRGQTIILSKTFHWFQSSSSNERWVSDVGSPSTPEETSDVYLLNVPRSSADCLSSGFIGVSLMEWKKFVGCTTPSCHLTKLFSLF